MIAYLPLINCTMPENFKFFIIEFFGISKASIPFEYLPDWIPNPLSFLDSFKTKPIHPIFTQSGYVSVNFIYNFSSQLWTMVTVLFLYLLLCLGSYFITWKKLI